MIMGVAFPLISGMVYIFDWSPIADLDWTPVGCTGMSILFAWNIFRYQMLDLAPIARQRIFEELIDALIILDVQGRIVDTNPAAKILLNSNSKKLNSIPIAEISPALDGILHEGKEHILSRLDLKPGAWFDLRITPFINSQGQPLGKLIIIQDITESKRAEEQV